MLVVVKTMVQWGDCDEQGIVFYPRYFYWMDCGFQGMLRACDLSLRKLRTRFGILGIPLVKADASFAAPISYDDELLVEAEISRWGNSSFQVGYNGTSNGRVIFQGNETRVWLSTGKNGPNPTVIPDEFRTTLDALSPPNS